jgi:hypothetical protein
VLGNQIDGPLAYATQWNLPLLRKGADVFGDAVARWTAFYRQQGIERICTGAVILRKRKARRNWMRKERMPRRPTGPAGSHILRVFEAQDHLSAVRSNRRMLDDVFSLVDGHWLDQRTIYREGQYHTPPARLHVENGVGLSGEVEPLATHVLFRMDGKRSVRDLVQEAARDTGVSKRELTHLALETIRELYALGLLVRVSTPS